MFSFIHLLPLFFFLSLAIAYDVRPTFNVLSYGANPNRFTENSNAFLRAWHAACASNTGGRVLVPRGSYVLGAIVFLGPCKGPVDFIIKGTLEASDNPVNMFRDHWITFRYLDQLVVTGGGFLYGHGKTVWHLNDCAKNSHCKQLPYTMRFDFVKNSRIEHINSVNSRSGHFDLFSCYNVEMSYIRISAPYWSPNTDGIRTQDVDIQRVQCGPGHGFSIGSLGKYDKEQPAQSNVQIRNVTFSEVRGTSSSQLAVKLKWQHE
ncbi:exopolygalacturonase-like protein [Tanacetum coccineum]